MAKSPSEMPFDEAPGGMDTEQYNESSGKALSSILRACVELWQLFKPRNLADSASAAQQIVVDDLDVRTRTKLSTDKIIIQKHKSRRTCLVECEFVMFALLLGSCYCNHSTNEQYPSLPVALYRPSCDITENREGK